jgi:L-2-amino-thiazoline-4-carboxylic acid hydrolase-like protein
MEHLAASGSPSMPVSEALQQILTTAERMAMLYYHFASTLVGELGDEKGKELIQKAIAAYGTEVGERQRARVAEAGKALTCENYKTVPDLPMLAWSPEGMPKLIRDGKEIAVCPLAKYWIEKGAADLGRLYCYVDQAKFSTFDPACECRHLKNVLEGDDCCVVAVKKRSDWAELDRAR